MFCPYCGNETPDGGKFCIRCGGNLEAILNEEKTENLTVEMKDTTVEAETDVEDSIVEIESPETEQFDETTELSIRDDALELEDMVGMINNDLLDIELLDRDAIKYFKEYYFKNGKYSFPLSRYIISFDEDIVMSINTNTYFFRYVVDEVVEYCSKRYKKEICEYEDLEKIMDLYADSMVKIASLTLKFMVASGIMSYTENKIAELLGMGISNNSKVSGVWQHCLKGYERVMSQYDSAEAVREMNKMLSSKNGYIAGGFGFKGVLGGMAAAGVANAASGLMGSIKDGVAKASNKAKMRKELNHILHNSGLLDSIKVDIKQASDLAEHIYQQAYLLEYNIEINTGKYYNSSMKGIADNTIRYVSDKEVILKDLSEVIGRAPLGISAKRSLLYLAENFYDDKKISKQLQELSNFLLIGEVDECIKKKKEEQLQVIFKLPEKTIDDVDKKIKQLSEKSKLLAYDASEQLERLQRVKNILLEEEAKREAEEQARREHEAKIRDLMQERILSAQKVNDAIKTNNMTLFGEMSASGDMVAEERYIQYYVLKIKNGNNKKLFDAIASQCGNNRAYDCIVGICCFEGYGTIKNREIAEELLRSATEAGCTYAKGYLARLVIMGMSNVWIKERAQLHINDLLEKVSPYICAWNGSALCKGTAEGGSNKIPNDYDKALFYTEYAYKCGMEEAKDTYYYLQQHSASEINSKRYTSDSSCYITTAVCNSFGKADDCYELTLFRNFRDSYLLKTPSGKQLVEEYYVKAPKIVAQIDALPEREMIYYRIWDQYLQRCMRHIQKNELEDCRNVYVTMVKKLEAAYL